LTKPRLRSLLDEIYRDVTYNLDDDSFAEAEDLDIVRKRFIRSWESLVDGYRVCHFLPLLWSDELMIKDSMTDHNYQSFFNMTVESFVRPWEKYVMGMRFSEVRLFSYERLTRLTLICSSEQYGTNET
jgi:hypothetical protein